KYVTIIHDAVPHPGDRTAIVTPWLRRDAKHADLVVTLCRAVAERIITTNLAPPERVLPLFHPDLTYGGKPAKKNPSDPFRLLFFGRIMAYKGLPLLIDAIEALRQSGFPVELGVVGSGALEGSRGRLEALGAEITNRWIDDSEVCGILARYDAMACSHVEASQSGVVSTALGNGMPVVAMPIGGIAEQVIDGRTGVLARQMTAPAFGQAIRRLATEPRLYETIVRTINEEAPQRSMDSFLSEITEAVLTRVPNKSP
ncbi:MAG: glycosyltransferase family 4 protein, partial [Pseudomonadota bacterium]